MTTESPPSTHPPGDAGMRPQWLPRPPRVWVDRQGEVAYLRGLAAAAGPARVVLHGLPGIGKSSLAATWLTAPDAPAADLRLCAMLTKSNQNGAVTANDVLAEWLRQLGVARDDIPAQLVLRGQLFQQCTRDLSAVVLIDNADNADNVRALLPGSENSTVVVTSARRLGGLVLDGFEFLEVPALPPEPAAQLLAAYRATRASASNGAGWAELARRCEHHPLTLCIAAAYLANRPHTGPADLAATIAHRPATAPSIGGHSLGVLLHSVYDDLDPLAAALYRLLPDHPGNEASVAVLADALRRSQPLVEDAMSQLCDAHLAHETGPHRYEMPRSVRHHARRLREEHDGPDQRDDQLRAMITWYCDRAAGAADTIKVSAHRFSSVFDRRAGCHRHATAAEAHAWFERERPNILAALTAADDRGWDDLVIELAEAVWDPLRTSHHINDLVRTQTRGRNAALRACAPIAAVLAARRAFGLTSLGNHDAAVEAADEAVHLAQQTGDSWITAMTLSTRARARTDAGNPAAAILDLSSALELDEQRSDRRSIALRHRRLGQAHLQLGDHARAVQHLYRAVAEMAAVGDDVGRARSLTYLAEAHLAAGEPARALSALHEAGAYLQQFGSVRYRFDATLLTARAHQQLGDQTAVAQVCAELLTLIDGDIGPQAERRRQHVERVRDASA